MKKKKSKIILFGMLLTIFLLLMMTTVNIINGQIVKNNDKNLKKKIDRNIRQESIQDIRIEEKNLFNKNNFDTNVDEIARMLLASILIPPSLIFSLSGLILSSIPTIFAIFLSSIKYIFVEEGAYFLIAICAFPFILSLTPLNTCYIVLSNQGKTSFFSAFSTAIQEMVEGFQLIACGDFQKIKKVV